MNKVQPFNSGLTGSCSYTSPSFTLKNRVARFIWGLVWLLLFRSSPRPMHAWRTMLLRLFGAKMGNGCHIYPGARIWAPWNLYCENEVAIADGVTIYNQAPVYLNYRVVVSQGAHLCTGTHDYNDASFPLVAKPIWVGNYAWLCAESFVLPGVRIEEGAVIGARAVVSRDMPAWTVCAGNPCVPLKARKRAGHNSEADVMENQSPGSLERHA